MNKSIKVGSYILTALIGGTLGATFFPKVETKTEVKEVVKWKTKVETKFVDKLVYKDRVKTKVVTRTITKKDGTVIVEKEDSRDESSKAIGVNEDTKNVEQDVSKEKVFVKTETQSTFHIGLGVDLLSGDFEINTFGYDFYTGFRVNSLPIWIGPRVSFDNNWKFDGAGISLQWEF